MQPVRNWIYFGTGDVMLTPYFHVCKLWVLPLNSEDRYWSIGHCVDQTPKYANMSCNFSL